VCGKAKLFSSVTEAKASPKWAFQSHAVDPKPGDLHMVRMKRV
jgi:hypothetical protein